MKISQYNNIEILADKNVDERLLAEYLAERDNVEDIDFYKQALTVAAKMLLTAEEKTIVKLYYYDGVSQKNIAEELNISGSAVSKKKAAAIDILRSYILYTIQVRSSIKM